MLQWIIVAMAIGLAHGLPFQAELNVQWREYKKEYNKSYSGLEEFGRRLVWEQNLGKVTRHNLQADLGQRNYKMGMNHLSDLTNVEVSKMFNGYKPEMRTSHSSVTFLPPSNVVFPDEVDWRKEGYVTAVRNQGQCGSASIFAIVGAVEGSNKKKTGKLVTLSVQNLIDCAGDEGHRGCEGGLMDDGYYEYIMKNGIDTEVSYPFEGTSGPCRFTKAGIGATISGYVDLPSGKEDDLLKAVATVGPVSVAIDASQTGFQLYVDGVYDDDQCSSTNLDHGVLIVGYGSDDGLDYWLVKNSWGASWGLEGYIKMSRNKNNQCGIATAATYPLP